MLSLILHLYISVSSSPLSSLPPHSFPSPPVTPSELHMPSVGLTPGANGGEHCELIIDGILLHLLVNSFLPPLLPSHSLPPLLPPTPSSPFPLPPTSPSSLPPSSPSSLPPLLPHSFPPFVSLFTPSPSSVPPPGHQELSGIPESTIDSLSFSELNSRLEQVKKEFEQRKLSEDEGTYST